MPNRNTIQPVSITEYDLAKDLRRKKRGGLIAMNDAPDVPTTTAIRNSIALSFRHVANTAKAIYNALSNYHRTAQYDGLYPAILEGGGGMALSTWYKLNFQTSVSTGFSYSIENGAVQLLDHSTGEPVTDWRYVAQRDEDVRLHCHFYLTTTYSYNTAHTLEMAVFFTERNTANETFFMPLDTRGAGAQITGGSTRFALSGGCIIRLRKGDSFCIKIRDYGDAISPINAGNIIAGYGYISIDTARVVCTDTIGMIHEPN